MTRLASVQRPVPRQLVALVWVGVAFFLIIGVTASALRATHLGSVYPLVEPIRTAILDAIGVTDQNAVHRADLVAIPHLSPVVGAIPYCHSTDYWIRRTRPGRTSVGD